MYTGLGDADQCRLVPINAKQCQSVPPPLVPFSVTCLVAHYETATITVG